MSTTGEVILRKENVERMVKGFALEAYTMKQLLMVQSSSSWQESYFQETAADLTASGTRAVKGIPRLAGFPYGEVEWTKKFKFHEKHGLEGVVAWEDAHTDNIDVIARTLLRIARAVAKSVDDEIWDVLSEGQTATLINSVTIAAGDEWDSATIANRDPIQDILDARKEIRVDNYQIGTNGFLLLNPTDMANLLGNANIRNAGQFYTDTVTKNGVVGRGFGLTWVESNSITDNYAMVVIAKECGTWKTALPLTVVTIEDPMIKWTIRAGEIGVTQLINPEAVCLIINTAA